MVPELGLAAPLPVTLAWLAQSLRAAPGVVAVADAPQPGFGADKPIDFGTPAPETPAPQAPLAATPEPQQYPQRGGPLTFGMNGNLTVGERLSASSRGPGDNHPVSSAGFFATLARRTPLTSTRFSVPVGVGSGRTTFGEVQAGFDHAKFSLSYQSQSLSAVGLIPLGSTLRGPGISFPTRYGDVLAFAGPASADGDRGFAVRAIRARALLRRGFLTAAAFTARANDGGAGAIDALSLGYATVPGRIDGVVETIFERTRGLTTQPDRSSFSYEARGDFGSSKSYATAVVRSLPAGFAALGGTNARSDVLESLNYRTRTGATALNFETSFERSGDATGPLDERRSSLNVSAPLSRRLAGSLYLASQRSNDAAGAQWSGIADAGLHYFLPAIALEAALQTARSTTTVSAPTLTSVLEFGASKFTRSLQYQASYEIDRQSGAVLQSHQTVATFGVTRLRERSSLGLSGTLTHTTTPVADQRVQAVLLNVARRISPAVSLTVQGGLQHVADDLNPRAGGLSTQFNLTLGAPFAFGNGTLGGHIDPRLPATIIGTVVNDAGTFADANAALPAGVSNLTVVLDGKQTQRTDSAGRFEFRFLRAGRHEISLDPASLPRGITADEPFVAVSLQGGQVAQLALAVGAFGAVEGRVLARDRAGKIFPIPDVNVRVDQFRDSYTTITGAFGFGRLAPGAHTLEIRSDSFPANVGLVGERTRSFTVRAGERVSLDFRAEPLGSISGKVVSDGANGEKPGTGIANAYVIADPGDHAAITSDNGVFTIDNLSPGTYKVTIDEETLAADLGTVGGPAEPIKLEVNEQRDGLLFTVGKKDRPIDFTFSKTEVVGSVRLAHPALPPGGASAVVVSGAPKGKTITLNAFGKDAALVYDAKADLYRGIVRVPPGAANGEVKVSAHVGSDRAAAGEAVLKVDGAIPIAAFSLNPLNPARGQFVHVRARFLATVASGDRIAWEDGAVTKLTVAATSKIVEFDVKVPALPYRGILVTPFVRASVVLGR